MAISDYFDIFDFEDRPNNPNNISKQFAYRICKSNQKEMQSIIDEVIQKGRKNDDFSDVAKGYLVIRLKPEFLPEWWKRGEVYRTCNQQQWEKAVSDGKRPEQVWIIEETFPVKLPT